MTTAMLERYNKDTANHVLQILHDDDLYRHLRIKNPGHGYYWFDIVTWPGALTIKGDMGTFTFSRLTDMFKFFRQTRGFESEGRINPSYWAEKVDAADTHCGIPMKTRLGNYWQTLTSTGTTLSNTLAKSPSRSTPHSIFGVVTPSLTPSIDTTG